jgi:glycerophosphoryl diester phosphodiesterase
MSRPLLLGHRGARAVRSVPENTFACFDRALAEGCDGFEFDVRLTADGEAVVCHDPKVGRFQVARTAARQLPALPRLRDVLARYRGAFLDIELKVPGLERIVVEILREHRPRRFVVSSFLPGVLTARHRRDHPAGPDLRNQSPTGPLDSTPSQLCRRSPPTRHAGFDPGSARSAQEGAGVDSQRRRGDETNRRLGRRRHHF